MNELKELIEAAQAAFHAEEFETAENKARQALALSATATDAMTIMGGVQLWRQNFEEAASWFSHAMEAAPEKKELRSNLLLALGASAELKLSSGDVKGGSKVFAVSCSMMWMIGMREIRSFQSFFMPRNRPACRILCHPKSLPL